MNSSLARTAVLLSLLLPATLYVASSQRGASSDPDDVHWDESFGSRGPDAASLSGVATGGGNLYVAGDFTLIDGVAARNIARWDGTEWSALGDGIEGDAWYMTADGNDLYVSGFVYGAGGDYVNAIARWDGSAWHPLGDGPTNGVDGIVYSVMPDGDNVYVGGNFDRSGNGFDTTAALLNNIARWNRQSNTWHPIVADGEAGVKGGVYAMALADGLLYVGGRFDTAGTTPARSLAVWDTRNSSWSSIGEVWWDTTRGTIRTMLVRDGYLYVAGSFDSIGTVAARSVARWHIASRTWSAIGADSIMGEEGYVRSIISTDNGIYVVGDLDRGTGDSAVYAAHWDESRWTLLPRYAGTPGSAAGDDTGIYGVEGLFGGSENADALWLWNGTTWNPIARASGASYVHVDAIASMEDDVYMAGRFGDIGGVTVGPFGLARWNRTTGQWSSLPLDTTQDLIAATQSSLHAHGSRLYVGGYLYSDGDSHRGIAAWDSDAGKWDSMNGGVNGSVTVMQAQGDRLYVGGQFDSAGGRPALGVAIWNETTRSWSSLGLETIAGVDGVWVDAMVVGNNEVYLAGYVSTWSGGGTGVIRWRMDGSAEPYDLLALDMNGSVNTMVLLNGDLYVGGDFTELAGLPLNHLARWDGTDWKPVGENGDDGVNGPVNTLVVRDGDLFVGGSFDSAGTTAAGNIARWDGEAWNRLGSGTSADVRTIAATPHELFLGGDFLTAGEKPALHIARWTKGASSVDMQRQESASSLLAHPNPVTTTTDISFPLDRAGMVRLEIVDPLGHVIAVLTNGMMQKGEQTVRWDASGLPSGIYYCRLRTAGSSRTTRLMVVR